MSWNWWGYFSPHFFTIFLFFHCIMQLLEGTERKNFTRKRKVYHKTWGDIYCAWVLWFCFLFGVFVGFVWVFFVEVDLFVCLFCFKRNSTATFPLQEAHQDIIFTSITIVHSCFWSCKNICGSKLLCRMTSISTALVISYK